MDGWSVKEWANEKVSAKDFSLGFSKDFQSVWGWEGWKEGSMETRPEN